VDASGGLRDSGFFPFPESRFNKGGPVQLDRPAGPPHFDKPE
jgi:hypothetical protein